MKPRPKSRPFPNRRFFTALAVGIGLLVSISLGISGLLPNPVDFRAEQPQSTVTPLDPSLEKLEINGITTIKKKESVASPAPQSSPAPSPVAIAPVTANKDLFSAQTPSPTVAQAPNDLGHLAYEEASPAQMVSVGDFVRENYVRTEYLQTDAAASFLKMQADAQRDGVQLMPISGFRSVASQRDIFDRQIERKGSREAAAQVSAPPGHSEHHTGYAIDITEAQNPEVDLKYAFEQTRAYSWLLTHAQAYGFELSFPKNNRQNVSFEPWHWRYIASPEAAQIFLVARS